MIEIRPILEAESEAFLELMCDVFELDFARAIAVFNTEPFYDLNRKWALFEYGKIQSILTTTPLTFGWGPAYGVAGVATRPGSRRMGLSSLLLRHVLERSQTIGDGPCLLFARDVRLYEKLGLEPIDDVVRGEIRPSARIPLASTLALEEVKARYETWVDRDPNRLRRDEIRWNYWNWNLRACEPFGAGYLCLEVAQIREAIIDSAYKDWPVAPGSEWVGLKSLTRELEVPLVSCQTELALMGYGVQNQPQLFLTDQF